MKKKYFAPELEELELDEPFVLPDNETSPIKDVIGGDCNTEEDG